MRRFLLLPALLVLALTMLAQTAVPSPDGTGGHSSSACTVAGRVVTAAEGNPLRSARVALTPQQSRTDTHTYTAISDSDGRFLLKDVPPGRYSFLAVRDGFVEQPYQSQGANGETVLSLKAGEKIEDVLFRMTRAAVITGRLSNEDGEPVVDARIVALQQPSEEQLDDEDWPVSHKTQELRPAAGGHTDDRGQYRIYGLRPGEYYIRATDDAEPEADGIPVGADFWVRERLGSEYAPVYYSGASQAGQVPLARPNMRP